MQLERFLAVRARTEALAERLTPEDQQLQAFPSASPVKWHRAHTTWFFETFVLGRPDHPWSALFNSYYEALGPRHARPERGLLSRPTAAEIGEWRRRVDDEIATRFPTFDEPTLDRLRLGLAHEQQHQELVLTDVLAAFARHPLRPAYAPLPALPPVEAAPDWIHHPGGRARIGADRGLVFDNEGPAHDVWLEPFALSARLVTVREWAAFAADGGYRTPSLWLSDGLDEVRAHGLDAPAYTRREGDAVVAFGLHGERELHPDEPVVHLSFYEADALATWLGGRLPTEAEWEAVFADALDDREDDGVLAPRRHGPFGSAWQWTRSSYAPYPGFRPAPGAIGEYNGKFMVNQQVLRGGSVLTPPGHSRPSYRNFWPPATRFQATGLRLARDAR